MSVKSTITLDRAAAEERHIGFRLQIIRRAFEAEAKAMSDAELEESLTRLLDSMSDDGESLRNFCIERKAGG